MKTLVAVTIKLANWGTKTKLFDLLDGIVCYNNSQFKVQYPESFNINFCGCIEFVSYFTFNRTITTLVIKLLQATGSN